MKKTMIRLAGLAAAISLFAFIGAGCTGGGGDEAVPPATGAKATDNASVGQPVTSGEQPTDGTASSGKGGPGGPKGNRGDR